MSVFTSENSVELFYFVQMVLLFYRKLYKLCHLTKRKRDHKEKL